MGYYEWLIFVAQRKDVRDITSDSPHLFYRFVRDNLSMFHGAATSVMPRQNEWHFIEAGRYLERAENLLRLLQSLCQDYAKEEMSSYPLMLSVLKSVSGYESFRREYADTVNLTNIIKYLMLHEAFPRSINYSFQALERSLKSIELEDPDLNMTVHKLAKLAGKVKANLACMDEEDILSGKLEMTLLALRESCNLMGMRMSNVFFLQGGGYCMKKLEITHITRYSYTDTAQDSVNEVRLTPLTDNRQSCYHHSIITEPVSPFLRIRITFITACMPSPSIKSIENSRSK